MAIKTKTSRAIIFLGLYLICLGVLWLFNTATAVTRQEVAAVKYKAGNALLESALQEKQQYAFKDEAHAKEFNTHYEKLKKYIEQFNEQNAGRVPFRDWLITAVIISTAIAYVFSGILLLRHLRRFKIYFTIGSCGFVAHYLLIAWAILSEAILMNVYTTDLMQVLFPGEQASLPLGLKLRLLSLAIIVFGVSYGMYVALPQAIIRRSKAIAELVKGETSVA